MLPHGQASFDRKVRGGSSEGGWWILRPCNVSFNFCQAQSVVAGPLSKTRAGSCYWPKKSKKSSESSTFQSIQFRTYTIRRRQHSGVVVSIFALHRQLLIDFVDSNRVQREMLWSIIRLYGIPYLVCWHLPQFVSGHLLLYPNQTCNNWLLWHCDRIWQRLYFITLFLLIINYVKPECGYELISAR